jgi:NAD(P)-dependent dehydrogenase (short-subunit alcohol dehydrogenase family)
MDKYRFEGRVAVVTGAGRGIGRGYALLLAERGAKVVVNDIGGSKEGVGSDPGPALTVATEISEAGGEGVPNTSDVSTVEGGKAVIDTALEAFGRIDIVVNNAGNIRWGGLPEVEVDNIENHLAVHVKGSFNTTRAAWPYLLEQNYGRVVMTGSAGMFGLPDNLGYATAKAAILGMVRSMSVGAGDRNIKVNVIVPNAWTRMAGSGDADDVEQAVPKNMAPELVAPMVGYLAHEACAASGEVYLAGAGRFSRVFLGVTTGYLHPDPEKSSIEDVAEYWATINDETGYYIPTSLMDWASRYMSHL